MINTLPKQLLAAITFFALFMTAAMQLPTPGNAPGNANHQIGTSPAAPAANPFNGGTLHNATLQQWRAATQPNKIATAADWLAATKWKGQLNKKADFDHLEADAKKLAAAVDGLAETAAPITAAEAAASIITLANDLGPR